MRARARVPSRTALLDDFKIPQRRLCRRRRRRHVHRRRRGHAHPSDWPSDPCRTFLSDPLSDCVPRGAPLLTSVPCQRKKRKKKGPCVFRSRRRGGPLFVVPLAARPFSFLPLLRRAGGGGVAPAARVCRSHFSCSLRAARDSVSIRVFSAVSPLPPRRPVPLLFLLAPRLLLPLGVRWSCARTILLVFKD